MREIISIHVGNGGVGIGNQFWQLLAQEHQIQQLKQNFGKDKNQKINQQETNEQLENNKINNFFNEVDSGHYYPRSIFIDTDPSSTDLLINNKGGLDFDQTYIISCKEDCANNFGCGYNTIGASLVDLSLDRIHKMVESCNEFQGFMIYNSIGGGTGSGLTALIIERLKNEFNKKEIFNMPILPYHKVSYSFNDTYNALLNLQKCHELVNISVPVYNEALYDISKNILEIDFPNYQGFNQLTAQLLSTMTTGLRQNDAALNTTLNEFEQNLVPYPAVHYLITGLSALFAKESHLALQDYTVPELTIQSYQQQNSFTKSEYSDGKFMATSLFFRGYYVPKDICPAIMAMKTNRTYQFVDWCPTGFKCGISYQDPVYLPDTQMNPYRRQVLHLSNQTTIKILFKQLLTEFQKMYKNRAFVHHYCETGLEEGEFQQSIDVLTTLLSDYDEIDLETEEILSNDGEQQY